LKLNSVTFFRPRAIKRWNRMDNDLQLLREYAANGSEEAFRELVNLHSGMVHGVARRIAGDDFAEEVTQGAFLLLARKAGSIKTGVVLAGWLHRATRFVALEVLRRDKRKRELAENLSHMEPLNSSADSVWTQLAPLLDEALDGLRGADREAVVLRFLEGRSFAEVAAATDSTEAATKMRVARALEKLRGVFARKGVVLTAALLASALSSNAATAAPAGIASAVLAKSATTTAPGLATLLKELLFMKKIKIAVVAAGALLLTGSVLIPVALHSSSAVVTTFYPMTGEWTGSMEMSGAGGKATRPVELSITTSPDGRRCQIDMRVAESTYVQKYHFSHELDETGKQIATLDDPRVALLKGFGKVIAGENDAQEWEAAVRTPHANGYSECRWIVRGDELIINRHDRHGRFLKRADQYSKLELRRKSKVAASL